MGSQASALSALLIERLVDKLNAFLAETNAVSPAEALRFARPDWPSHRWGIGQNGSIAGIVYHVAAWKQMTLPLLQAGKAISLQDFDAAAYPSTEDWPGLIDWYTRVGLEWIEAAAALSAEDYDRTLSWEGKPITVTKLVQEIIDHDIQHASQIEYLRQRLRVGD
jgi:hypothetical protein